MAVDDQPGIWTDISPPNERDSDRPQLCNVARKGSPMPSTLEGDRQPLPSAFGHRRISELKTLPALLAVNFKVSEKALLQTAKRQPHLWEEPVTITQNNEVVDRYDIVELARRHRRDTLLCVMRELSSTAAVRQMLAVQSHTTSVNSYLRIRVALAQAHVNRPAANLHQQLGGRHKALSKLTEADRIDLRSLAASWAGVGTGSVTKVQQLERTAVPDLKAALSASQLSIHAAWKISKLAASDQRTALAKICGRESQKRRRRLYRRQLSNLTESDQSRLIFFQAFRRLKGFPEFALLACEIEEVLNKDAAWRDFEDSPSDPRIPQTAS